MIRFTVVLILTILAGCAARPGPDTDQAVADFINVSELEELRTVRTRHQYSYTQVTERYIVLKERKERYLVEFSRRCRELNEDQITPDIRRESNVLRSGADTIRGCHIKRMFAIDIGQAEELLQLGKAPGQ